MRKSKLVVALSIVAIISMLTLPVLQVTAQIARATRSYQQRPVLSTTRNYVESALGLNTRSSSLQDTSQPSVPQNCLGNVAIFASTSLLPQGRLPDAESNSVNLVGAAGTTAASFGLNGNHSIITSSEAESRPIVPMTNETVSYVAPFDDTSGENVVHDVQTQPLPDLNGTVTDSEVGMVLYGSVVGESSSGPSPPAALLDLAKEGHWFPNKAYSQICYEVVPYFSSMQFYISISKVEDRYSRYFRIYYDGSLVFVTVMRGFSGYVNIPTTGGGYHKVTLEIQWGYYSDHGWKLVSFNPTSNGAVTGEFFPQDPASKLRFNVYLGLDTKVDLEVSSAGDPSGRYLYIYVDGILKYMGATPFAFATVSVGDYGKHSLHEITVEVNNGGYVPWGWRLKMYRDQTGYSYPQQFSVHFVGVYYEVDYMTGYRPQDSVLSYILMYYKNHGYERPVYVVDQEVQRRDYLSYDDYYTYYYNVCFGHKSQAGIWKYILYGGYYYDYPTSTFGWIDSATLNAIFIAAQLCYDTADDWINYWFYGVTRFQTECVPMMHECGHSIHIIDLYANGDEFYCDDPGSPGGNPSCVMAGVNYNNLDNNPFYCAHHWSERVYP